MWLGGFVNYALRLFGPNNSAAFVAPWFSHHAFWALTRPQPLSWAEKSIVVLLNLLNCAVFAKHVWQQLMITNGMVRWGAPETEPMDSSSDLIEPALKRARHRSLTLSFKGDTTNWMKEAEDHTDHAHMQQQIGWIVSWKSWELCFPLKFDHFCIAALNRWPSMIDEGGQKSLRTKPWRVRTFQHLTCNCRTSVQG